MPRMLMNKFAIPVLLCLALLGCSDDSPPVPRVISPQAPVGVQMVRAAPGLKDQRFTTLLDFESENDSVFLVMGKTGGGQMSTQRPHTGLRGLRLEPGTRRVAVKLASVMGTRPFPGQWTLAGAFFYCEKPLDIVVSVDNVPNIAPRTLTLTPGKWTMALTDISTAAEASGVKSGAAPLLTFELPPHAPPVWCDDVLLIDNSQTLVDRVDRTMPSKQPATTQVASSTQSTTAPSMPSWSIEKRGLSYVGDAPGFNFKLTTSEAIGSGWAVDEANDCRARFHSTGAVKRLTIYSDGRAYWDGSFRAMTPAVRDEPALRDEHESPAEIIVPEELGRVERSSDGDKNNDGYNEICGAYHLIADGMRIEFTIVPHVRAMNRPVFEVRGLPAGKVLITSEGRLIESSVRLDDGAVLFELPGVIDRPTQMNVRLQ